MYQHQHGPGGCDIDHDDVWTAARFASASARTAAAQFLAAHDGDQVAATEAFAVSMQGMPTNVVAAILAAAMVEQASGTETPPPGQFPTTAPNRLPHGGTLEDLIDTIATAIRNIREPGSNPIGTATWCGWSVIAVLKWVITYYGPAAAYRAAGLVQHLGLTGPTSDLEADPVALFRHVARSADGAPEPEQAVREAITADVVDALIRAINRNSRFTSYADDEGRAQLTAAVQELLDAGVVVAPTAT